MKLNMKLWLKGIISAASGGISTAMSTIAVSPETINSKNGLGKVLIIAGVSSIVAVVNFLKQSPLPAPDKKDNKEK